MKLSGYLLTALIALSLAGPATARELGAEDMFNMMRGMSSMLKMWNAFSEAAGGQGYSGYGDWSSLSDWGSASGRRGLDGVWVGTAGDRLELRGQRFSLCPGRITPACSGRFRIYGDRFIANSPMSGVTLQYQFRRRGDILLLRDDYDNYLLFRRVGR